jgi:HEAT repeat protein
MRRLTLIAIALLSVTGLHAQSIQEILDSKALQREYNPVLVGFLLEEGKSKLPSKQQKEALDQQLSRFREEINVKPSGEATAAAATLAGMLVKGDAGAGIAQGAAEVWGGWVDAALTLQKAGYAKEVIPFYENCVKNFPYESLQARCAVALAAAEPDKAVPFLISVMNDASMPEEAKSASLRVLGQLASERVLPKDQRDAAVDELIKRTEGFMNSTLYPAAVDGLVRSHDPRAVEPLKKMLKGMSKSDEVKKSAMRGLALVYKDPAGIEALKGGLKGGMMSDPKMQIFCAATLIRADEQAGFDWAADKLAKKQSKAGGFMSKVWNSAGPSDNADPEPQLMAALFDNGNEKSKAMLAQVIDAHHSPEWIYGAANIDLLRLGDASRVEAVKKIADDSSFIPEQRAQAAIALAKNKEYSGIAAISGILNDRKTDNGEKMAIADALAIIDRPECVPPIAQLLGDKDRDVRFSAAYALSDLTRSEALDAYPKALSTNYGNGRDADVQAHLIRAAAHHFGKNATTVIESGKSSQSAPVRLLAIALTSNPSSAPATKKKS